MIDAASSAMHNTSAMCLNCMAMLAGESRWLCMCWFMGFLCILPPFWCFMRRAFRLCGYCIAGLIFVFSAGDDGSGKLLRQEIEYG